jgi:hypothetical protein
MTETTEPDASPMNHTRRLLLRPAVRHSLLSAWAVAACAVAAVHASEMIRAPIVVGFLCFGPGMALTQLFKPRSLAAQLALAIGLSLGPACLIAISLVYVHRLSPLAVLVILTVLSIGASAYDAGLHASAARLLAAAVLSLRMVVGRVEPRLVAARFGHLALRTIRTLAAAGPLLLGGAAAAWTRTQHAARHLIAAQRPRRLWRHIRTALIRDASLFARGSWSLATTLFARLTAERVKLRQIIVRQPQRVSAWAHASVHGMAHHARASLRLGKRRSRGGRLEVEAFANGTHPTTSHFQGFLHGIGARQRRSQNARGVSWLHRHLRGIGGEELVDRLSWPALHRFLAVRTVQQIDPKIWLVEDLGPGPWRTEDVGTRPARGVWIIAASETAGVPLVWRLRDSTGVGGERTAWRSPLALEALDSLEELGCGRAVVVAGQRYGSLSTFRAGLKARGLEYLVRVDALTALDAIVAGRGASLPWKPSAADAQQMIARYIEAANGAVDRLAMRDRPGEASVRARWSELLALRGSDPLVLGARPPGKAQPTAFWLSNLPTATSLDRLSSLMNLPSRLHVERAHPKGFVPAARAAATGEKSLENDLAIFAFAQAAGALKRQNTTADSSR